MAGAKIMEFFREKRKRARGIFGKKSCFIKNPTHAHKHKPDFFFNKKLWRANVWQKDLDEEFLLIDSHVSPHRTTIRLRVCVKLAARRAITSG